MGNIYPAQVIFEGDLRSPTANVRIFTAMVSGLIRAAYLWTAPTGGPFSASMTFNVRLAGVPLWTGSDRLIITMDGPETQKTGLAIPVTKGQRFALDLDQVSVGARAGRAELMIETEES